MSKVPDGWERKTIGDLIHTTMGFAFKSSDFVDAGIQLLRMGNLYQNSLDLSRSPIFLPEEFERLYSKFTVHPGDLVMSMTGTLGKRDYGFTVKIPKHTNSMLLNQRVLKISSKESSDIDYIMYLLRSDEVLSDMYSFPGGTKQANLSASQIKALEVLAPPLTEQQKIAKILSTWDKAISATEQLISNSQQQKKALMHQLLESKIRFPKFYKNFSLVKIKDMGKTVSGGTPDTENTSYWNGDISWLTPTDVTSLKTKFVTSTRRMITRIGVENSSAKIIPTNSLLVCTRATVGLMAISTSDITTNQGFKNLVPNNKYDVIFLYYLFSFNKKTFIRYACGSTFLEISKRDFERLELSVPELPEQQKIAQVLTTADREIELLQKKLAGLKQEKQALMQQLLTGKRRVVV